MKLYHYTSHENLRSIFGTVEGERSGLRPRRRFIPLNRHLSHLPEKSTAGAVFGLLDPLDPAWCVNDYIPGEPLLETILGDISTGYDRKLYLLEATLTAADDAHVAEHLPHLRPEYDGRRDSKPKILRDVKTAYWESLQPIATYLQGATRHVLAEGICFSTIPKEQLRVCARYDRDALINTIRGVGGYRPHPPRPEPDPEAFEKIFGPLLKRERLD